MNSANAKPENPKKLFPMFVTEKFDAVRRFYAERLGCKVLYDTPEYVHYEYGDGPEIAFVRPDAFPGQPPRPVFGGAGAILSVPTADADALHAKLLKDPDATVLNAPTNKPWGWRSFWVADPTGLVLDFFHVVEEKPMQDAQG